MTGYVTFQLGKQEARFGWELGRPLHELAYLFTGWGYHQNPIFLLSLAFDAGLAAHVVGGITETPSVHITMFVNWDDSCMWLGVSPKTLDG